MSKHNTIGKGESERAVNGGLDKYYTKNYIADYYSNVILERYGKSAEYIEPTAGNGAFLRVLPNIQGYDLLPEREDIIKMDVFNNTFTKHQVIVGNPPFGSSATLAVKIFEHIASFEVKAICFIVPKTFKKASVQNKLNSNYHLVLEQDLVKDAFTVEGKNKDVPCVFQIWEYKKKKRVIAPLEECEHIEFTTQDKANIAVRRVGGKAGQVLVGLKHSKETTYFIKASKTSSKALKLLDLACVDNTAGVRSISKEEIRSQVNRIMTILKGVK